MCKAPQILLVEDNRADTYLMKQLLGGLQLGVEISAVKDGDEALEFTHRTGAYTSAPRPDLIFLDLNLPKVNGMEVLRSLKSDESLRKIPVLVLTSSKSPHDISESYSLGANAFLVKPHGLEELDQLLRSTTNFWLSTAMLNERSAERHC